MLRTFLPAKNFRNSFHSTKGDFPVFLTYAIQETAMPATKEDGRPSYTTCLIRVWISTTCVLGLSLQHTKAKAY